MSLAAGTAVADQWTVRTGVHLDAWSANNSPGQGNGYQLLVPLGIYAPSPDRAVSNVSVIVK